MKTEQQIVDAANDLARQFYLMLGYQVKAGFRFDLSGHPQEQAMWAMACRAYDVIEGTDVEDALNQIDA